MSKKTHKNSFFSSGVNMFGEKNPDITVANARYYLWLVQALSGYRSWRELPDWFKLISLQGSCFGQYQKNPSSGCNSTCLSSKIFQKLVCPLKVGKRYRQAMKSGTEFYGNFDFWEVKGKEVPGAWPKNLCRKLTKVHLSALV